MKLLISEQTHQNGTRIGEEYETDSLSKAKRFATRKKAFCNTLMCIDDAKGNRLSVRFPNGKLDDTDYEKYGR